MNLLLDTHVWLWSLLSPANLSKVVAKELENPDNQLWLSPISVWETIILVEKKRVLLNLPVEQWLKQALSAPIQESPITNQIAIKSRFINLPYQDPADRFIAATAIVNSLTLVTADKNIALVKEIPCLLN